MLHLPNNCRSSHPKIVVSKKGTWCVFFTFYDDNAGKKRPVEIKAGLNRIHNLKERAKEADKILKATIKMLGEGVNYISYQTPADDSGELSVNTGLIDALTYAKETADFCHKHKLTVNSMLKFFGAAAASLNKDRMPIKSVNITDIMPILTKCCIGKSAKTFNRYRKDLSSLFSILVPLANIANPVRDIPKKTKGVAIEAVEILSKKDRKEIDRKLKAKGKRFLTYRLFNRIFFTSGSRIAELLRLKTEDVDLADQSYTVVIEKGKNPGPKKRTISNSAIYYWQYALRNAQPGQFVFGKGLKPNVIPTTTAQVTRRWEIHVKEGMGITANYNSLRHSLATDMADNYGQDATATHLQHKGRAMVVKVYDKKAEERLHEERKKRVVMF